ncbi:unnamed protein product [Zymoseptoria tritici ST99CH_3D1]|nr:unnamed protein product [Zymoseptoria tritici ST99CH_3D1]
MAEQTSTQELDANGYPFIDDIHSDANADAAAADKELVNNEEEDFFGSDEEIEEFELLPPPERVFSSLPELKAFIKVWTREHGYDLVIRGSKNNGCWKDVRCRHAGTTRNYRKIDASNRRRKTGTRKHKCPMRL